MRKTVFTAGIALGCLAACLPAFAGAPAPNPTPEPSTILLVAGAGGALLVLRQLRKRK